MCNFLQPPLLVSNKLFDLDDVRNVLPNLLAFFIEKTEAVELLNGDIGCIVDFSGIVSGTFRLLVAPVLLLRFVDDE